MSHLNRFWVWFLYTGAAVSVICSVAIAVWGLGVPTVSVRPSEKPSRLEGTVESVQLSLASPSWADRVVAGLPELLQASLLLAVAGASILARFELSGRRAPRGWASPLLVGTVAAVAVAVLITPLSSQILSWHFGDSLGAPVDSVHSSPFLNLTSTPLFICALLGIGRREQKRRADRLDKTLQDVV
ncbi:hypothetical protein [Streptomyces qinglanensis]|uniref:hypothetical protein n=1 Tax=Streptomyces qinglanensis TaxID=943816 RepID=UPI003D72DBEA